MTTSPVNIITLPPPYPPSGNAVKLGEIYVVLHFFHHRIGLWAILIVEVVVKHTVTDDY